MTTETTHLSYRETTSALSCIHTVKKSYRLAWVVQYCCFTTVNSSWAGSTMCILSGDMYILYNSIQTVNPGKQPRKPITYTTFLASILASTKEDVKAIIHLLGERLHERTSQKASLSKNVTKTTDHNGRAWIGVGREMHIQDAYSTRLS